MLYIDYRPKEFEEILGNRGISSTLEKMLSENKVPQVILFSGTSGCGKTTLARILANKLMNKGDEPVEMNLSHKENRGIDGATKLMDMSHRMSFSGGKRIFILDEVDQTTPDWQKSMKKHFEDTPKNAYFFMCTTKPEKLIKDIHTRATTFEVEIPNERALQTYLTDICKKEKRTVDRNTIREITKASGSSIRKALVNLNTILNTNEVEWKNVLSTMNPIDNEEVITLCRALLDNRKTWDDIRVLIKNINVPPESIRMAVKGYMNAIMLNGTPTAGIACCVADSLENFCVVKCDLTLALYKFYNL